MSKFLFKMSNMKYILHDFYSKIIRLQIHILLKICQVSLSDIYEYNY